MGSHSCRTPRWVQVFHLNPAVTFLLRDCDILKCLVDHKDKSMANLQRLLA